MSAFGLHGGGIQATADDFIELVVRHLEGRLTPDESTCLNARLNEDAASRDIFVALCTQACLLASHTEIGVIEAFDIKTPEATSPTVPSSILGGAWQGTVHYFSQVGPMSYLVATVLLAMILVAGSWITIHRPVANHGKDITGHHPAPAIGYITALADCQWKKTRSGDRGPGSGISEIQIPKSSNPKIPIFLGDRFQLASGLMEITYDTGAVVLLQGPCTYQIDSARGGYLAVGKLTALVEKGSGVRGPGSGNVNHSPLFAVRTPTAVVTDLGTEFGVEVEQSGATRSHVFQGKVELRENSRRLTTSGASPLILHAGQSARVKRGRNSKVAITCEPGQPDRFVRRIPSSFIPDPSSLSQSSRTPDPGSQTPLFHLTDLGTLGGAFSRANAINALGHVVGEAATADGATHAFRYANGAMKDLGTLHGGNSCAKDINAFDQVVGWSTSGKTGYRAFFYEAGKMRDLGTLGGATAYAYAVNDAGVVVGASVNSTGTMQAFIQTRKSWMKGLGALGGPKAYSCAFDINASGQVAGFSETGSGSGHAFLYREGVGMKDLGKIIADHSKAAGMNASNHSTAFGINDAETVVGTCEADGLRNGFICNLNVGLKNLGALGGVKGCAYRINNLGQIVGIIDRESVRAFFYSGGKMLDLSALVEQSDGWMITGATGINDSGQIAGFGRAPNGKLRAILLTPVKRNGTRD